MSQSQFEQPARLLWDADGVLVDSQALAHSIATDIMRSVGVDTDIKSQEDYRRAFGVGSQGTAAFSADECRVLREIHRLALRTRATELTRISDGIEVLSRVAAYSSIVTSAYADGIFTALRQSNLRVPVMGCECGSKVEILNREKRKATFVYITDTTTDIARCREVGAPVIAVTWGYDNLDHLEVAQPDYICSGVQDLIVAIEAATSLILLTHEQTAQL